MSVQRVKRDDCQKVINKMKRKHSSSSTIHHAMNVMSQLFSDAIVEQIISQSPVLKLDVPRLIEKERKPFSNKELKKIYDTMYSIGHGSNAAYAVATQFLMETGARRGEALGVMWKNVDREKMLVRIQETVTCVQGKTKEKDVPKNLNSIRHVPISHDLLSKMDRLGHDCEYVFHTKTMKPLSPNNFLKTFRKYCVRAGVPYRSPHTLRHTFVTDLIDSGESPETVKALSGHKSDRMLSRYTHTVPSSVSAAMLRRQERLGNIFGINCHHAK